jgi:hypothetical protein
MIYSVGRHRNIDDLFKTEPFFQFLKGVTRILIKINLSRPPIKDLHPRTDKMLLQSILSILKDLGKVITVCESADGYLAKNLDSIGILSFMKSNDIGYIDIDDVDYYKVKIHSQEILIPKFFNDSDIRISLPCASKREGMLFSNNIKNCFGATPRIGYIEKGKGRYRAGLHHDLTTSVINVYDAFDHYANFHYYINGGNAYCETRGSFMINDIFLSNNAIELDKKIFEKYFSDITKPDYLIQLEKRINLDHSLSRESIGDSLNLINIAGGAKKNQRDVKTGRIGRDIILDDKA